GSRRLVVTSLYNRWWFLYWCPCVVASFLIVVDVEPSDRDASVMESGIPDCDLPRVRDTLAEPDQDAGKLIVKKMMCITMKKTHM
ncbi:8751_t:CDS:2, partial [Acaulospora morrowiae]